MHVKGAHSNDRESHFCQKSNAFDYAMNGGRGRGAWGLSSLEDRSKQPKGQFAFASSRSSLNTSHNYFITPTNCFTTSPNPCSKGTTNTCCSPMDDGCGTIH